MTNEQKAVIRRLRQQNNSYVSIANTLGVSVSAVKGYCQRNGLTGLRAAAETTPDEPSVCLGCGKPITQREGIKLVKRVNATLPIIGLIAGGREHSSLYIYL